MEEYLSEKEQWEWIKAQVRENGPAVILAVAVVAAGVRLPASSWTLPITPARAPSERCAASMGSSQRGRNTRSLLTRLSNSPRATATARLLAAA